MGAESVPEVIKYFTALGVGGVLAWGMFIVYRKDMKAAALQLSETARRHGEQWAELSQSVIKDRAAVIESARESAIALTNNTRAIEANTTAFGQLQSAFYAGMQDRRNHP